MSKYLFSFAFYSFYWREVNVIVELKELSEQNERKKNDLISETIQAKNASEYSNSDGWRWCRGGRYVDCVL